MKRLLFLLIFVFSVMAQAGGWVKSYRTAKAQAIRENKKILIFFSGSDWCEAGWRLDRELFRTQAFQDLASRKYVLYNADFPKYTRLGQEAEDRNRSLASRYGIHHFPAVAVVDPKFGTLLVKQIGLTGTTPKKLLDKLLKIEKDSARPYNDQKNRNPGKTAP